MNNEKPLSYLTNRISIIFIVIFFITTNIIIYFRVDHREIIISLLIALSGSIALLVVTIASPNKQIDWLEKILNKNK